ncbi:MAG: hypothetical protein PHI12_08735 [Dehalococcoidales bacterium]|nr:hypothetical protein [Dehalococcoidales bacterium]
MQQTIRCCQHCSKPIIRNGESPANYLKRKYCSKACSRADQKGKHPWDATIK